jgi:hypothetical protein
MKAWAEKNPKLAMAANVVLDIIAGGAKGTTTPKVKAMANSIAKNMKTAAKNSFGSMNPRMKIGYNGRFDALPPGDLRIRAYESANLTNQPGLNRIGAEQYPNGHFKSNGVTGWGKQVEITPSYEVNTAEVFENPYYMAA